MQTKKEKNVQGGEEEGIYLYREGRTSITRTIVFHHCTNCGVRGMLTGSCEESWVPALQQQRPGEMCTSASSSTGRSPSPRFASTIHTHSRTQIKIKMENTASVHTTACGGEHHGSLPPIHTHTHTDCSFSSPLTPNTIWRSWGSFLSPIGSVQGPAKRNSRHWLSAPFQQHSQKMQGDCPMELSVLYHPNTSKHGPEFNHPLGRLVCLWFLLW